MPAISVTLEEAWALARYVRQTDKLGMEHDKDQQQRLHVALAWLKENPASTYDLDVDEAYCWWADRQVPDQVTVGTAQVGRNLLLKVQAALRAVSATEDAEPDAPGESAVPAAFAAWSQEEARAQAEWEKMQEHAEDTK